MTGVLAVSVNNRPGMFIVLSNQPLPLLVPLCLTAAVPVRRANALLY
jgi:hypothetical protein